jgi:hypothetical protein
LSQNQNLKRSEMIVHRRNHFLLFAVLVCFYCTSAFVPSIQSKTSIRSFSFHDVTAHTISPQIARTTSLQMTGISPVNPNTNKTPAVILSAILLALLIATAKPPSLEEGYLMHIPPVESSTLIISKLEVKPLGGGGFGGFGIGPGFAPIPFGGFGFGFSVQNRLTLPTEQQVIEAQKQKLEAVKECEQRLEAHIKSMEQQQPKKG